MTLRHIETKVSLHIIYSSMSVLKLKFATTNTN